MLLFHCFRKNTSPPNDENYIRDKILYRYLKNKKFKNKNPPLCYYQFDSEVIEKKGRVDIRVLSVEPYLGDYAYYIIECKRLDNNNQNGTSGLNGEYIIEGIKRFISKIYPFYKNKAGMIGFVVAKMDINNNVECINKLLKEIPEMNTQQELKQKEIVPLFNFSYYSSHNIDNELKYIYHLMFDFSDNVEYIAHCLEAYKNAYQMAEKDVLVLFKKHDIFDYINSSHDSMSNMSDLAIAKDINYFIESTEKGKQNN